MKIKLKLLALLFALLPAVSHAGDIASVNVKAIKDDLRAYYLSKPENAELKVKFEDAKVAEKKQQEAVQKALIEGEKPFDMKSVMKLGGMDRYQLERNLDKDLNRELYLIVSKMGNDYDFIYDSSSAETIIYAKKQVVDLTIAVKQAIFDLGGKSK
ncbi:MAG: hypothetical protein GXP30_07845 [Verrucomicrobia bacterium]|nr:hypothetical protein [Verrucomicrobiota bacterium]